MCLFPKEIPVKLYNGDYVKMKVPCGKCVECLQLRVFDWTYRLQTEMQYNKNCVFVTLTYSDEYLPESGVQVHDLQLFFKRLRKRVETIRYYAIGEYGTTTFRPHYHAIIFSNDNLKFSELYSHINASWTHGFIQMKTLTKGRIKYVVGYLIGQSYPEGKNKPFSVMSKKPALGSQKLFDKKFVLQCYENNFAFIKQGSRKIHVPRYFKRKLDNGVFTKIDQYLIRCKQCMQEYEKKLEYLKTHHVQNEYEFLHTPINSQDKNDFRLYLYSENLNKDYVIKQRSKKLRKL